MKKFFSLLAAFLLITTPAYAYHTETQTPYGITNTLNNDGSITVSWQESDGLEDNQPEYYIVYIGLTETADDVSVQTTFGFTEALSWQVYNFTAEYLYDNLSVDNQKIYAKVKAFHDTNNTTSDFTPVESVLYNYDYVPTSTTSSSTTTTTTTTTTTLPKAQDVVEDNITTYLAWDEYGCEHPGNPLSYKQYLEAIESGVWYGYQNGDCTDVPDIITIIIAEEDEEIEEDEILEENILVDGRDTLDYPEEDFVEELTEEEIAAIEEEIRVEEERLILEQIELEEEAEILLELEETINLEDIGLLIIECPEEEIECVDLTEEEIAEIELELQEFIDVIQELEELNLEEEFIIVEEEIILDIPDDIIVIQIEEEEVEEEIIIDKTEVLPEVNEEILVEPIQEDVEEEPVDIIESITDIFNVEEVVELTEEELQEEVAEIEEVIVIEIEIATEEEIEEFTEEELVEYEEAKEEAIQEYVQELTNEEASEVLEEVNDIGVQNLDQVSEEVQEIVQAVVEEAIEEIEELTEEQVEVVAEVLQIETEDVEIIAEAVKEDEVVAEAVEEYVERAVENADVENYTLADVVTEVQYEAFLENPIETFIDLDFEEITINSIGNDMTQDQKEKAQEVVVPVILTRIASMAAFIFRRS